MQCTSSSRREQEEGAEREEERRAEESIEQGTEQQGRGELTFENSRLNGIELAKKPLSIICSGLISYQH